MSIELTPRSASRERSASDGLARDRSSSARRERGPSAALKIARQSAKDQMRAAGLAKEKGEADMEEFIKDRDVRKKLSLKYLDILQNLI